MGLRLLTGILLSILVILGVIFLPPIGIKCVVAVLVILGTYEGAKMILPREASSSYILPVVMALGLSLVMMFGPKDLSLLLVVIPVVVMVSLVYYIFFHANLDLAVSQVARTLFTVFYFGFLISFLGLIRDLPQGGHWLFMVLAATFAADTGAYFVGRYLGRRKLAPQVSPGKTVEGYLGGICLSIVATLILKYLFFKEFSVTDFLWVGVLAGAVGPFGDLGESLLKRSVGVKDSGNLLPGHGGLLDRVDALLFTSPLVYWYAVYS